MHSRPRPARVAAVGMALLFSPRGGSAQVARYLARALEAHGTAVELAVGSLGEPGAHGHARTFFGPDMALAPLAYDDAVAAWRAGADPMDAPIPLHASFETKPDVPDRVLTDVAPAQLQHAVRVWQRHLEAAPGFATADVLHVHHLGVLQLAARAAAPDTPIVTHLHGTELKLLEEVGRGAPGIADRPHVAAAVELLHAAAAQSAAVVVNSPHDHEVALELLQIDPATTHQLTNGVDVAHFAPREIDPAERRAQWRRWLVDDAQGWDSVSGTPGSIRYAEADLDRFVDPDSGEANPVLMFVGRFLAFKRVPLLIRAYAAARPRFERTAPLVVWGGAPGEWEGEHPHDVARELGVEDVFFAGWRGHDELPLGLACSDALVAPSVDEPFGQVYLEAMACARAVVATTTGGPPSFVNVHDGAPDGFLVAPDDVEALADAMVALVNDPDDRVARGLHGMRHVRAEYAWSAVAERFGEVYESVV